LLLKDWINRLLLGLISVLWNILTLVVLVLGLLNLLRWLILDQDTGLLSLKAIIYFPFFSIFVG